MPPPASPAPRRDACAPSTGLPPASCADAWLMRQVGAFARLARHPLFWVGARDLTGVAVGTMAWGFMTGVAMVKSGLERGMRGGLLPMAARW